MSSNVGTVDRVVRLVVAGAAVAGAFAVGATTGAGIALLVIGAVMLVTAGIGFCPLYRIIGLNTCRVPEHRG